MGADIVFVESPESEDEMARIGGEIEAPLLANMVEGGRTPMLPAARLQELGYAMAIYPAVGFLAMTAALSASTDTCARPAPATACPGPKALGWPHVRPDGLPGCVAFEAEWAARDTEARAAE